MDEQRKIASSLAYVDAKIGALRRQRSALLRFKQGMLQKIFSQELRFRRQDGSEFPDWEERPFSDLATRVNEQFDPRRDSSAPRIIELEHIESGTGRLINETEISDQISLKSRFQLGDILFGKLRPYLRKYVRPDFDGVCSSEIWVLRPKAILSTDYLYVLVQSERFCQVANISSGSKMPRADWKVVSEVEFSIPHADEQRKIADAFFHIDAKITGVFDQITKMEAFKKGLLQQMFV